jgi:hypothetical protein
VYQIYAYIEDNDDEDENLDEIESEDEAKAKSTTANDDLSNHTHVDKNDEQSWWDEFINDKEWNESYINMYNAFGKGSINLRATSTL